MKGKKLLSFVLCVALAIMLTPAQGMAGNGPYPDQELPAYISFAGSDVFSTVYSSWGEELTPIVGVSYDKTSNTLVLDNVKLEQKLSTNVMGDDFKIQVKGNCELTSIEVWGDGYGGNLTITGDGTLTLNKNKSVNVPIVMQAEKTAGLVRIDNTVNVNLYAAEGYEVICTNGSSNASKENAVIIEGKTSSNFEVLKSDEIWKESITMKAVDVTRRLSALKWEKDGKYYLSFGQYNDGDTVDLYELVVDEEYGNIANGAAVQRGINPVAEGYISNPEGCNDVLNTDEVWYFPMYHNTAENKDYGIVSYYEEDKVSYSIYNLVDYKNLGKFAIPATSGALSVLPDEYEQCFGEPYTLYNYQLRSSTLQITAVPDKKTDATPAPTQSTQNTTASKMTSNVQGDTVKKPEKVKIKSLKNSRKKSISITWGKAKNAAKYEIQYSLSRKFKKGKKYKTKIISTSKTKYTLRKLTKKKTYYIRIRAVNGKSTGKWSGVKKVAIRK